MKCPKCGATLPDTAKFCGVCGSAFQQNYQQQNHQQQNYQQQNYQQQNYQQQNHQQQNYQQNYSTVDRRIIVNPQEQVIASMQSSMLKTYLAGGGLGKTELFFTNKRFYAKVKDFSLLRGFTNMDAIVDLEKISGSVLVQKNPVGFLVLAGLSFILGICITAMGNPIGLIPAFIFTAALVLDYFLGRHIRIKISYEGDEIAIPMRGCSYATADKFHKQLRNYLDKIKR